MKIFETCKQQVYYSICYKIYQWIKKVIIKLFDLNITDMEKLEFGSKEKNSNAKKIIIL